jgi:hypothetical protein
MGFTHSAKLFSATPQHQENAVESELSSNTIQPVHLQLLEQLLKVDVHDYIDEIALALLSLYVYNLIHQLWNKLWNKLLLISRTTRKA